MSPLQRFVERKTGWACGFDDLGYNDDFGLILRIGNGLSGKVEFEFGVLGYTLWAGRVRE